MSKVLVSLALVVVVFGMAVYTFLDGGGVSASVQKGHASILESVRTFDYVSE